MTAAVVPPRRLGPPPRPVYVTAAEFHRLWDDGFFTGLRRVILVDGEMIEMPMSDPVHDGGVSAAYEYLRAALPPPSYHVRNQQGFNAGLDTDPGPDLAVVVGTFRDYLKAHPTEAVLIVEVTNSSLAFDRREKAHIYAAAGVPEYWVLDVLGRELVVFRTPVADPAAPRGHRYATEQAFGEADAVSPLAAPTAVTPVAALLP
jgi:Uma2 family endonuclease